MDGFAVNNIPNSFDFSCFLRVEDLHLQVSSPAVRTLKKAGLDAGQNATRRRRGDTVQYSDSETNGTVFTLGDLVDTDSTGLFSSSAAHFAGSLCPIPVGALSAGPQAQVELVDNTD